jgi:hypothetical protein
LLDIHHVRGKNTPGAILSSPIDKNSYGDNDPRQDGDDVYSEYAVCGRGHEDYHCSLDLAAATQDTTTRTSTRGTYNDGDFARIEEGDMRACESAIHFTTMKLLRSTNRATVDVQSFVDTRDSKYVSIFKHPDNNHFIV